MKTNIWRSRLIFAQVLLILVLSGCAAKTELIGIKEPDLTKIRPKNHRIQVERILGKRLWHLGTADGLTYDIYQYDAEHPARPVAGIFILGVDYFFLGMPEGVFHDSLTQFQDVKQVAVAYDEQDYVRFISKPWEVPAPGPCRRMRCLLPADSNVPLDARPSPMVQEGGVVSETATLEIDKKIHVIIDGRKIEERVVELSPGHHAVSFSSELGGSFMLGSMSLSYDGMSTDVELLPGRRYRVKTKRYHGWGTRADAFWIEDVDSGETLYCAWPSSH